MYYFVKLVITAAIIVAISETSKRSALMGGFLASLPLMSYLGIVWLYYDTREVTKVMDLSVNIFWLVIPTLPFFVVLPFLLKRMSFAPSLLISTLVLFFCYLGTLGVLRHFKITS